MEHPHAVQPSYEDPQASVAVENAPPILDDTSASAATLEKWSRTVHPRGRQVRDPLAQAVQFQCNSMDSMKQLLRDYLSNPTSAPEHTTIEFTFPTSAAFMAYTADFGASKQAHKARSNIFNSLSRTAVSVIEALKEADQKDQMRKQKAIARAIVESISEVDGYRYSFHNNWLSKEDEAYRFSYYCNDSTLNKGRAANEGAGMEGKKKVKPVYDCKGLIWIKFSVTKNDLEIHYKHVPLHKTYEERAPPPRKDSRRRKLLELFNPEKLPKLGRLGSKRKSTDDQLEKPRKRRATEPPRAEGQDGAGLPQDESLAPLMEFLGSADRERAHDAEEAADGAELETPFFPSDKMHELQSGLKGSKPQKNSRPKKPALPGMMSGYMAGDLITWGERGSRSRQAQTPLEGITDAAAEADPIDAHSQGQMSELDLLKAKLAAAEAKIHNLEAEKGRPYGPPGWPPNPPPQQYNYPPPPAPQYYQSPQYQQPTAGPAPSSHTAGSNAAYGSSTAAAKGVTSKAGQKKTRHSGVGVNGQLS